MADYKPGGIYWSKVEDIMRTCSCSKLKAISALKSHKNDSAAAVASLSNSISTMVTPKPVETNGIIVSNNNIVQSGKPNVNNLVTAFQRKKKSPIEASSDAPEDLPENYKYIDETSSPVLPSHTNYGQPIIPIAGQKLTGPGSPLIVEKEVVPICEPPRYIFKPHEAPILKRDHLAISRAVIPKSQWDFELPSVTLDSNEGEFLPEEGRNQKFSVRRLIHGLQHGVQRPTIEYYLSFFAHFVLEQSINQEVLGFPVMFYVVASNDEKLLRTFANAGGDVNIADSMYQIPLLAFSILMTQQLRVDTTEMTLTLLSLGANCNVIPKPLFTPCADDPVDRMPFDNRSSEFADPRKAWCTEWVRRRLASSINITQRYFLEKKLLEKGISERQMQVAQLYNSTSLLGVSYFLIGQTGAVKSVTTKLLSHFALPSSKPLVLMFCGPSGHGKTELAKRMGQLLSLEMECIDCTEMKHETDLFGPKKPYLGYEAGAPLNNFLARLSGKRSIVFLDEFEKTTKEVHNSLLIPFDEGRYIDRRNRQHVDTSKTIWVIATNAVDDIILDFCEMHHHEIFDYDDQLRHGSLTKELAGKLAKQIKSEFGSPLSGRISTIVPFLPFSPTEAAIIAHKYLLELKRNVKKSVKLSGMQLVGHINLEIRRDGAICSIIASDGYDCDQGARSLKTAVQSRVGDELVVAYLEESGQIEDTQEEVSYTVDLARNGIISVVRTYNEP